MWSKAVFVIYKTHPLILCKNTYTYLCFLILSANDTISFVLINNEFILQLWNGYVHLPLDLGLGISCSDTENSNFEFSGMHVITNWNLKLGMMIT